MLIHIGTYPATEDGEISGGEYLILDDGQQKGSVFVYKTDPYDFPLELTEAELREVFLVEGFEEVKGSEFLYMFPEDYEFAERYVQ